jgi:hypothetical protein
VKSRGVYSFGFMHEYVVECISLGRCTYDRYKIHDTFFCIFSSLSFGERCEMSCNVGREKALNLRYYIDNSTH